MALLDCWLVMLAHLRCLPPPIQLLDFPRRVPNPPSAVCATFGQKYFIVIEKKMVFGKNKNKNWKFANFLKWPISLAHFEREFLVGAQKRNCLKIQILGGGKFLAILGHFWAFFMFSPLGAFWAVFIAILSNFPNSPHFLVIFHNLRSGNLVSVFLADLGPFAKIFKTILGHLKGILEILGLFWYFFWQFITIFG